MGDIMSIEKPNENKKHYRRDLKVVKSNELIQKTRYTLSAQEQKVLLYTISKIKPNDTTQEFSFNIKALCEICGIGFYSKNYNNFKDTIKKLADKSFWIKQGDKQVLCRWYNKVVVNEKDLTVYLRLDDNIMPYLTALRENYTSYILENVLVMESKYSIRLYEILKSYAGLKEYSVLVDTLKDKLQCAEYPVYNNFKVRVLDTAINEINNFTDIRVSYTPIRENRRIVALNFNIETIDIMDYVNNTGRRYEILEKLKEENKNE
jgi:plasmid replication initiation protein